MNTEIEVLLALTDGQILTTLPGVKCVRAAAFAAFALPLERFPSPGHLYAATGLAPARYHQSVPSKQTGMGGGMGTGSAPSQPGMQGMMSDADMTSLHTLNGTAFDKMWLTMMTIHHTGAMDMAKTELTTGRYEAAKALAQDMTSSQSAQINQMKQLLTRL